jgi:signal transduction histidine kinase
VTKRKAVGAVSDSSQQPPVSVSALDAFVDVLANADAGSTTDAFYGRLCEVICRLGHMDRAVLFRYDEAVRRVRAAGAHGMDVAIFEGAQVSVESAPIARRALEADEVVEAAPPFEGQVPSAYAPLLQGGCLFCVPVVAADRWIGVVLCDRAVDTPLSPAERHALWTLGKTAALAAMARIATFEGERARELQHRIDMARDVHDGVVQRLFGVSMALDGGGDFPPGARSRAAAEIQAALADLRSVVQRPLGRTSRPTGATLAEELQRLTHLYSGLTIVVGPLVDVPAHLEPLAQSVLAESLRNADNHAEAARVTVRTYRAEDAFILEVTNDGIRPGGGTPSTGMGLRLAAFEALHAGGFVEFGRHDEIWKVRLVVPIDDDS